MVSLLSRSILCSVEPVPGRTLDSIQSLEAGETAAKVAGTLLGGPLELVAVLAFAGLGGPDDLGPDLVQKPPERAKLRAFISEPSLESLFPKSSKIARLSLAAGLFQILDFWEESHTAAQTADDLGETLASSYWHAIAHRREPDPGNAMYWFRRVGVHPVLERLGDALPSFAREDADKCF